MGWHGVAWDGCTQFVLQRDTTRAASTLRCVRAHVCVFALAPQSSIDPTAIIFTSPRPKRIVADAHVDMYACRHAPGHVPRTVGKLPVEAVRSSTGASARARARQVLKKTK